jgi:hypothetical protein
VSLFEFGWLEEVVDVHTTAHQFTSMIDWGVLSSWAKHVCRFRYGESALKEE